MGLSPWTGAIIRAVEDVKRAASFGCRSFLLYDEGLLWILNEMRNAGEIPSDSKFEVSAHTVMEILVLPMLESIGQFIKSVRDFNSTLRR